MVLSGSAANLRYVGQTLFRGRFSALSSPLERVSPVLICVIRVNLRQILVSYGFYRGGTPRLYNLQYHFDFRGIR
jgi:hypothetical protein